MTCLAESIFDEGRSEHEKRLSRGRKILKNPRRTVRVVLLATLRSFETKSRLKTAHPTSLTVIVDMNADYDRTAAGKSAKIAIDLKFTMVSRRT